MFTNTSKCLSCGGTTKHYDRVKRIVRTKGGIKEIIRIPRVRCTVCNKIRRILPEHILQHKHYEFDIIQGVRDGLITSATLGYEDYPCEITMRRWSRA